LLREGLELWRGEPLADLRDGPFAQRASLQPSSGWRSATANSPRWV